MLRRTAPWILAGSLMLAPVGGCGRGAPGPAPDKGLVRVGTAEVPAHFAPARRVFETTCAKCHTIGPAAEWPADKPRPKVAAKDKGPDLSKIGTDHTRQSIMAYVRDPQAQNPKARMPKFAGKLDDDALAILADYLASLK
jgi:mono/diheme cytochrome c family protein